MTAAMAEAALDERLAMRRATLSPTEQRVADFFARHREEVAFLSATEIARRLGTSDATVVRAAQSLGYSGLQELKREFAQALRTRVTSPLSLGRRLAEVEAAPQTVLDHVLTSQMELLAEARRTVRPAAFARALDLLGGAARVLAFGTGPSAALADYFTLRLRRIGRHAAALTRTGLDLADDLLAVRAGDALVAVVYGRVYREAEVTVTHARARGVPVVLLTDSLGMALAAHASATLSARRGRPGMFGSIATPLVVMDALLIGLAARERARSLEAMGELDDLRAQIVGDRLDASLDEGMDALIGRAADGTGMDRAPGGATGEGGPG